MAPHPRHFSWIRRTWLPCLMLAAMIHLAPPALRGAEAPAAKEYQVKAAFLLNFAQFIQWPPASFASPDAPIVVGILGDDPFGATLDQTFQDETIDNRKLVIKRSHAVNDLLTCQMVFVAKSEQSHAPDIIKAFHDASVVTVGEADQFAQQGGIINFFMDGGKVRFEVNADAAQKKGLKINAQLLKRARIVASAPGKE